MKFVLLLAFLGLVSGQVEDCHGVNCTSCDADFTANSLAYGEALYVVDIWSSAFILPLTITNPYGEEQCLAGDILGLTRIQFECSEDGNSITKRSWNSGSCSGSPDEEYSWDLGSSPELDFDALINDGEIVVSEGSNFTLAILPGSGNIFDFSCSGVFAGAKLDMGVSCSNLVTVYGAVGAGCLSTSTAAGKLLVSCDDSGAYLNLFVDALSSGSLVEDNTCQNNLTYGRFLCDQYSALADDGCKYLLASSGTTLYGEYKDCIIGDLTRPPTMTDDDSSASSITLFVSIIFGLIAAVLVN